MPAMQTPCRLVVTDPAPGAWQMAVDELLLEAAAEGAGAALRFYRWSEPTLSLGYFQGHAERDEHPRSRTCACVRRQTGGGAILHDREITYCFVLPVASPLAKDASATYDAVHAALIETLAAWNIVAGLCPASAAGGASEPFLCFARRGPGDVVFGGAKICGSAQRRRRGAVMQHGSLLLAQSPFAPELPGVLELSGISLNYAEICAQWQQRLAARLSLALERRDLNPLELSAAAKLAEEKYSATLWNQRR